MSLVLIKDMLMFQAFHADNLAIKCRCSETTETVITYNYLKKDMVNLCNKQNCRKKPAGKNT